MLITLAPDPPRSPILTDPSGSPDDFGASDSTRGPSKSDSKRARADARSSSWLRAAAVVRRPTRAPRADEGAADSAAVAAVGVASLIFAVLW